MGDDTETERVLGWHREGLRHLQTHLRFDDRAALDQARTLFQRVVARMTDATPGHDVHLRNLAFAEVLTYELDGNPAGLADAVDLYRRAVDAAGEHGGYRHIHEYGLGRALRLLYQVEADPEHLDEAVAWQRRALANPRVDPMERSSQEACLAETLLDRHYLTGDAGDLADCVGHYRSALHHAVATGADQTSIRNNLGVALSRWQELTGDLDAGAEAASSFQAAADVAGAEDPTPWQVHVNLATAALADHARTARPDTLDEAIVRWEQAARAVDPADAGWPTLLDQLCDAHLTRGRTEDVDQVLRLLHYGRSSRPADGVATVVWTIRLSQTHLARHHLTGDPDDLEQAVAFARSAIGAAQGRRRLLTAATAVLAEALAARHQSTGERADLDQAIELCEGLLTGADPGGVDAHPDPHDHNDHRPLLAQYLIGRHAADGDLADLDRGIGLLRAARDGAPSDANRPVVYGLLGDALLLRFWHTGDARALDDALESYRGALAACGPADRRRILFMSKVAQLLTERYEQSADPADGDEAVAIFRYGVERTKEEPLQQRVGVANLAKALRARYEHQGDPGDLREAVDLLRSLTGRYPPGHPDQVDPLTDLTEALYRLYVVSGQRRLLREAVRAAQAAVSVDTAPVPARLRARITLGQAHGVAHEWEEARRAFRDAVELLPRLAGRALHRTDQQLALARHPGLAAEAAAYALEAGRPEEALEVLEHGRGVLLSRRLQAEGSDVDRLVSIDPQLAARFLRLRDAEDDPAIALSSVAPAGHPSDARNADEDAARLRRARAVEWERLLEQVRAVPAMADFLRPPSAGQILRDAGDEPVVLINVSVRCDAIIVAGGSIDVVRLAATAEEVSNRAEAFLAVVDGLGRADLTMAELNAAQQLVAETLEWLWDVVAEPVLRRLGVVGSTPRRHTRWFGRRTERVDSPPRRIWWCPQGVLAFLPLHAAGYHRDRLGDRGRSTLDLVVSSYTPTIGALREARERTRAVGLARPLVVTMPQTPGARPLRTTEEETAAVRSRLPVDPTVLSGARATRARVLAALRESSSAHFACHVAVNTDDPGRSHVLTHDHTKARLTVVDIAGLRLSEASLAYLSSCSTTRGRRDLADEAVHITGAFLLAGYRHVVGTLWPVVDALAPQITADFYTELASAGHDPDASAFALNSAARRARGRFPLLPSLWSAYVHVGP